MSLCARRPNWDWCSSLLLMSCSGSGMCRWHCRHRSRRSWWLGLTRRTQHGGRDTVTPIIITTQNITLSALSLLIIPFRAEPFLFRMIIFSTNVQMHLCMDDIFCQAIDSNEEIWTGMSLKSQPSDRISSRNAYLRSVGMSISGFVLDMIWEHPKNVRKVRAFWVWQSEPKTLFLVSIMYYYWPSDVRAGQCQRERPVLRAPGRR